MVEESIRWLRQAEADLKAAEDNLRTENYYLVIFLCHQVIEKGLKGLHIAQKSELAPRSHDLARLARAVGLSKEFESIIDEIDSDYLASRYPDAAEGIPAENFCEAEADSVLNRTEEVFLWIKNQSSSLSHSLDD